MIRHALVRGAREYRFLIDRGYNPKSALRLVENRYLLSKVERDIIYRGVYTKEHDDIARNALRRGRDILRETAAPTVYIDFFNNMTTIIEMLSGGVLSIGTDGLLRDHAKALGRSRKEAIDYLEACKMIRDSGVKGRYVLVGEKSISMSIEILRGCVETLTKLGINASFVLTDKVDTYLIKASRDEESVISTSDHLIVERTGKVVDIPMALLGKAPAILDNIIDLESIVYDIDYQFY